jgi:2-polyprenyl-3-methyl-5-hydroxy-6-metoxy-1,4-benzoquinol methylase
LGYVEVDGVRATAVPTCYLCGSGGNVTARGLRDQWFDVPGVWSRRICSSCQLAWLDPRPIADDIGKLYTQYFTHQTGTDGLDSRGPIAELKRSVLARSFGYKASAGSAWQRVGRAASHFGIIRDRVGATVLWLGERQRGSLLDIGCGNGDFLVQMKALGWEVAGVEPDPAAASVAKERLGGVISAGTLESADFGGATFDAITLSHVIEHVADPVGLLAQCRSLLTERGRVIVVTPNLHSLGRKLFGSDWRGWDVPRHLFLFSPESLATTAKKAGFHRVRVRTTSRAASAIWNASWLLRKKGRIRSGEPVPRRAKLEGRFFWVLEHMLASRAPRGEELVMTLSRAEFRTRESLEPGSSA